MRDTTETPPTEPAPHTGPWRALVQNLSDGVDRESVFKAVCDAGLLTGRYVMMSVLSAAIAILGLLLSSPAVVIGAMLLSPLMSPIILLGFSFWTVDWRSTRRAIVSLATGLGLALAVAVLLTIVSPLKEPTAEILARTRPNLFDLLVAAFSGVAGGYAVIRQRGETVIGVAIATALMPPIATVGFGIGTLNWSVALGALLLFATNLIAIALAAAGMAALYGFRPHYHGANRGWLGNAAVLLVLLALCVPLTVTLNTIGLESRATASARAAIREFFGPKARLTSLTVRSVGDALDVDGLVATPKFVASAADRIGQRLKATLGSAAHVTIDQVVLADPARLAAPASAGQQTSAPSLAMAQALRDATPFPTELVAVDASTGKGVVLLAPTSELNLTGAMELERGLRTRKGFDTVEVVPPAQALPAMHVAFDRDTVQLGTELAMAKWALVRWRAVRTTGTLCGLSPRDKRRASVEAALADALRPMAVIALPGATSDCTRAEVARPYVVLSVD